MNMTEQLKDNNKISLWETPCNIQFGTRLADLGRTGGLGSQACFSLVSLGPGGLARLLQGEAFPGLGFLFC